MGDVKAGSGGQATVMCLEKVRGWFQAWGLIPAVLTLPALCHWLTEATNGCSGTPFSWGSMLRAPSWVMASRKHSMCLAAIFGVSFRVWRGNCLFCLLSAMLLHLSSSRINLNSLSLEFEALVSSPPAHASGLPFRLSPPCCLSLPSPLCCVAAQPERHSPPLGLSSYCVMLPASPPALAEVPGA